MLCPLTAYRRIGDVEMTDMSELGSSTWFRNPDNEKHKMPQWKRGKWDRGKESGVDTLHAHTEPGGVCMKEGKLRINRKGKNSSWQLNDR